MISHLGDVIVSQIKLPDELNFIVATLHIHHRFLYNHLAMFFTHSEFVYYSGLEHEMNNELVSAPVVLVGN